MQPHLISPTPTPCATPGSGAISVAAFVEGVADFYTAFRHQKLPSILFLALCFNALCAPAVFAATDGGVSKLQAWAIALLGLTVVSLSGYLFVVMFQPERF